MNSIVLIVERSRPELPDVTDGIPCCMGSAVHGPGSCTCWEPIYNVAQAAPTLEPGTMQVKLCEDCAYRNGSPEKTGVEGYRGDQDMLEDIVQTGTPFWCHQGMRRVVAYRHPCGVEIPAHPAAYDPLIIEQDGLPKAYKADGSPADLCAGWCALRLKKMREEAANA